MQIFPKERYKEMVPFFARFPHQIISKSVLAGYTKGTVYADKVSTPTASLLNGLGFEILVAGDAGNRSFSEEAADYIANQAVPAAKEAGAPLLTVYPETYQWVHTLQKRLDERVGYISKKSKQFYALKAHQFKKYHKALPEYASLRAIDADLLKDETLLNRDHLQKWIETSWTSMDAFFQKGLGYCVIEDGTIAHWCLAIFAAGAKLEFALMTVDGYQGKGYAKAGASACMEQAIADGKVPLWNCNKENAASIAVAEALGFEKRRDYELFEIKL
ncbi:GNAT family N-acetyltransferase [Desmospora activa]|uniref:GNAT acetyltransferase-like protein n=1 Tax=Desmospora activa DSM 45169 TaxID=1121389 RepID=A0A2T4Z3G7_9BACL|nr:GNAT family N-acetyltransferase [Desmospora activa]PTM56429.1 GNAT acetyltransferase-like protein [Desmospora activa DSM 45169]